MKSNLCYILYDNYAIVGEYMGQDRYYLIERFDPDSSEEYIKEWFPEGLEKHQYLDMRTELQYAKGGIIPGEVLNPVHQYATLKFDGTVK